MISLCPIVKNVDIGIAESGTNGGGVLQSNSECFALKGSDSEGRGIGTLASAHVLCPLYESVPYFRLRKLNNVPVFGLTFMALATEC